MTDSRLVLINQNDNVLVSCGSVFAAEIIDIDGRELVMTADIKVGHKLARAAIAAGEKIIKYGASIGSATQTIQAGEHVHLHNTKSDYIPSHTRNRKVGVKG